MGWFCKCPICEWFDLEKIVERLNNNKRISTYESRFLLDNYFKGKDKEKHLKWLDSLADKKVADAFFLKGLIYEEGKLVKRDGKKSFEFYKEGIELGDLKSIKNSALFFLRGEEVKKDRDEAIDRLLVAASYGMVDALAELSFIYGIGLHQDKKEGNSISNPLIAYVYGRLAFYHGSKRGLKYSLFLRKKLKKEELEEASKEIYRILKNLKSEHSQYIYKCLKEDDVKSCVGLGQLYSELYPRNIASEIPKSDYAPVFFYLKSADLGSVEAMYNLAYIYNAGVGVEKDTDLFLKYANAAADKGDTRSMVLLGVYNLKQGDYPGAFAWCRVAAEKGDKEGASNMSMLSFWSLKDYKEAIDWGIKALPDYKEKVLYLIADSYFKQKDYVNSYAWFLKAKAEGFESINPEDKKVKDRLEELSKKLSKKEKKKAESLSKK